jgi:hypothetical protein
VEHPFTLLLALLPFKNAFKLWALLSYALAAFGAYAWARGLKRSRPAAVAAGLGFALSGSLVGASDNLTYLTTLSAIPWMFAAAQRLVDRPGPGSLALVGLASGLCAAGGDPQAWGFAVALLAAYPLTVGGRARSLWSSCLRGAQAAGAALVGAAPAVLPVLAWLPQSSRGDAFDPAEMNRWDLPLARLLEFVLPHMYREDRGAIFSPIYVAYGGGPNTPLPWVTSIYLGAVLLLLALVAVRHAQSARWLVAGGALFAWLALGPAAASGGFLFHLPLVSGFRYWEKMAIWPSLLLPVAAAFGLDALAQKERQKTLLYSVLLCGAAALAMQAVFRTDPALLEGLLARPGLPAGVTGAFALNLEDGLLHAGLVTLLLGLTLLGTRHKVLRLSAAPVLALLAVGDVFAANLRGYELALPAVVEQPSPIGDYLRTRPGLQRVLTPGRPDRQLPGLLPYESRWLLSSRLLEPCFDVTYRVGNFLPYTGMVPARADRYRRRLAAGVQVPHVGLFDVGYLAIPGSPEQASAFGATPPYDVVAEDPGVPAFLLRLPHRERAYLATELEAVDRRGAMEFALSADPARTTRSVIEAPVPQDYRPPAGSAHISLDEAERVAVETVSDGRALLVLNDIYAAGWDATVDGRATPIVPANYLARGVFVEPGSHLVEFRYHTPLLREGWLLFLLGGAALALARVVRRRSL